MDRKQRRELSRAFRAYGDSLSPRKEVVVVEKSSGGLGFGGALFLVFLVLKLTHVIAWSWWWVTAPLWIPVAFIVFLLVVGLAVAAIAAAFSKD